MVIMSSPTPSWARRKRGTQHATDDVAAPGDFTTRAFATILGTLTERTPIAQDYEDHHGQRRNVWYSSQRQHMVRWFSTQSTNGSGAYTRGTPNTSARRAYNRLLCSEAILWIAEALGADEATVRNAADAAAAESDHRRRCGKIRAVLPWDMIVRLAARPEGWRR